MSINHQLTINRNASLSYELGKQSTKAFAKQIGCFKLIRSSDIELFGLPGRTSACVPVSKYSKILHIKFWFEKKNSLNFDYSLNLLQLLLNNKGEREEEEEGEVSLT